MASHKNKQLESQILVLVSSIITHDIQNELANKASITEVDLTADGSIAKIYVVFNSNEDESFEALIKIAGYIRKQIASKLTTRRTPEIVFELDKKLESINEFNKILETL